ncbi:Glycerol kinase 2 [Tieghemostelium lacteum]|uniref:Probable glycerol kinase n=1 Tax=Tieghemostelium lacteum TaxID=361077 RepID=A0A152AA27_TIELA|nr:Glycerol kinase 2 [Tieghemostelium lacteum]|eukprot:KYR03076.1 Glycerol kinase 2 [Tieghemostelium lacteum]
MFKNLNRLFTIMSTNEKHFSKPFIGSLDQGTSSTRFILFDREGKIVLSHQIALKQHHPKPGWVEHDPMEIVSSMNECIDTVMKQYHSEGLGEKSDIKAIGITNQRETTVMWDTKSRVLHKAIVWCDTRTKDLVLKYTEKSKNISPTHSESFIKKKSGLPLSTYFSSLKIKWLKDNLQLDSTREDIRVGTVDSWLIWNLTGGKTFVTDVTNASRTQLMSLETRQWDRDLCEFFDVPSQWLPSIKSSSEVYGHVASGPLEGVPIAGALGDQQAAMVGQMCFEKGMAKNTYGTGCFLLYNTGSDIIYSQNGVLTTVCYQLGPKSDVVYALEGGVAVAGSGVRWLIDNLGLAGSSLEVEQLANQVEDTGGMYFVPAFSGLFAPYWRDDARGVMVGLSHHTNKCHISRAVLESTCFQTYEVLSAMQKDSGQHLKELRVDGGMAKNNLLLQIQSDILSLPVVKPTNLETTCFGAAYAAGLAVGVYNTDLVLPIDKKFTPTTNHKDNEIRINQWKKAVSKSLNWIE